MWDEFEVLLHARRDDVVARLAASAGELAGIQSARSSSNADDEHDPEGSTLADDWSRLTGLRVDAAAQLTAIDAALVRLAAGDYGHCAVCGRAIAPARLRARPEATTCVACFARGTS